MTDTLKTLDASRNVLFTCPAFDVVEGVLERHKPNPVIVLKHGDELCELGSKRCYSIGSVVGYYIENGDCPIKGLERAKEHGHDLHYIYAHGVALTAHKQARKEYIGVEIGQCVRFEGRYFQIGKAPNDNLSLTEVPAALVGNKLSYSDIIGLSTPQLQSIVGGTKPNGVFSQEVTWAKAELTRRGDAG